MAQNLPAFLILVPTSVATIAVRLLLIFLVTAVVMSAVLLGRLHCGSVLLWYLSRVLLSKSVVLVVVMLTRPQVSRPRPHPHVAAAQPVPDNAQRMNQHLRSSQVLATSLTMVNPVTELLLNDEQS